MSAALILDIPGHWMEHAACGDRCDDLFFPIGDTGPARKQERDAKAICARCPAREECRDWALDRNDAGIWGGLTEQDRRRIRRNRLMVKAWTV